MAVASAQVTVTTDVVALTAAESDSRSGESVLVTNTDGSAVVYLGASDVDSSSGYSLAAGASVSLDLASGEALYAVSAGSVVVHVLRSGV